MRSCTFRPNRIWLSLLAGLLIAASSLPAAPTPSRKSPITPKWSRFDCAFKSATEYPNALQDVSLTVAFTSPLGQTRKVYGFWDGGKTWRVRFAPDEVGRWSFKTSCSDTANKGLHHVTGEFTCSAPLGQGRFKEHGPVQVARHHRQFAHADGTQFFWLADTTWNGARLSGLKDWQSYAVLRANQGFTVAQWAVSPGDDANQQPAFGGFPNHLSINPEFFQRLDAKAEALGQAGLLSAIAPYLDAGGGSGAGTELPDHQAALLFQYIMARYGAEPVVWLVVFDDDRDGKKAARWQRIGKEVFTSDPHAPVIVYPRKHAAALDSFRAETWVDAFGLPSTPDTTEDALRTLLEAWSKPRGEPSRPLIPFLPIENGPTSQAGNRFTADDVRRAAGWGLLLTPPAGVSYAAQEVLDWDASVFAGADGAPAPAWRLGLYLPAAGQVARLAGVLAGLDYPALLPAPKLVANQPGAASPRRLVAASKSEKNDLCLAYVPEDRTAEMALDALPQSPTVTWFNPRTGEKSPAVAVVGERSCQFPTPDRGDWLLVMRAGR